MNALKELIYGGYDTDTLENKLRELFTTDKELIAKVNKNLENIEPAKRETFRKLLIDNYICDLVLASHMHEAGF